MTGTLTRRGFLALLGMTGAAMLLLGGGGCAHLAAQTPVPVGTPPPRAWDDSEILRGGRWAG